MNFFLGDLGFKFILFGRIGSKDCRAGLAVG